MSNNFSQTKDQMEEVILWFEEEIKNIRTGRANPSLVNDLPVDYYGVKTPLKQVSNVSVQDARSIVIIPWEKGNLLAIEKGIRESDLNLNPVNDGNSIRLNFPPLTEERRRDLVKLLGQKSEEARIRIRRIREEEWESIQKQEKEGEIGEDDKFRLKDDLQKIVDEYNVKVKEIGDKKEVEIMQI